MRKETRNKYHNFCREATR